MNSSYCYAVLAAEKRAPLALPSVQVPRQRRRRTVGRRVLFVDFDGVLHPGPPTYGIGPSSLFMTVRHFGWLPSLVDVLRPHPDVHVVVHSSWRFEYDEAELREILSDLGDRVLGATPATDRGRYDSILAWLQTNPEYSSYRILDDDPEEFPSPLPDQLIVCDPTVGVAGLEVITALRRWLSR